MTIEIFLWRIIAPKKSLISKASIHIERILSKPKTVGKKSSIHFSAFVMYIIHMYKRFALSRDTTKQVSLITIRPALYLPWEKTRDPPRAKQLIIQSNGALLLSNGRRSDTAALVTISAATTTTTTSTSISVYRVSHSIYTPLYTTPATFPYQPRIRENSGAERPARN